jgi:hypothetical protein
VLQFRITAEIQLHAQRSTAVAADRAVAPARFAASSSGHAIDIGFITEFHTAKHRMQNLTGRTFEWRRERRRRRS